MNVSPQPFGASAEPITSALAPSGVSRHEVELLPGSRQDIHSRPKFITGR
jgi:hypothetical protein